MISPTRTAPELVVILSSIQLPAGGINAQEITPALVKIIHCGLLTGVADPVLFLLGGGSAPSGNTRIRAPTQAIKTSLMVTRAGSIYLQRVDVTVS